MSDFWSNAAFAGSDYVEWEDGTEIVGVVTELGTHEFPESERGPARIVPKVKLDQDNGTSIEITCGPADLKKKMVAAAPNVGDRIKVTCIGSNKIPLGVQRFFKVDVHRASSAAPVGRGKTQQTDPAVFAAQREEAPLYPENPPF